MTKKSRTKKSAARKKIKKQSGKTKLILFLLKSGVVVACLVFFFVFAVYLGLFKPIPTKSELSRIRNNSATVVYSHDTKIVGKYFFQNRMTIREENISQYVKDALVSTEDSRFFRHKGLDFISLGRVFVKSIILGNRSQGGGSTISQQLARNLYPRLGFGKFTLPVNKVREIFISARIENIYSKDEILALYLNTVPFGDNVYGIEVASQRFFGKPSASLNPPEAATLIGMLAANTAYNPRVNPEKSLQRRNIVLGRMASEGVLSKEEARAYQSQAIKLNYRKLDYNNGPSPYFLEHIRPRIQKILKDNYGDEYNIYTDGLLITTTLDSTLQAYANTAVDFHLNQLQREFETHWAGRTPWSGNPNILNSAIRSSARYKQVIAAGMNQDKALDELKKSVETRVFDWKSGSIIVKNISPLDSIKQSLKTLQAGFMAMDPKTGHIKSWVGGRNFQAFKYDHVKAVRQVGSTFKPFLYASALSGEIDPCEFISNELRTYEDYQDWTPENSDGNHEGYYSVKGGLVNSVNTISAELIHQVGIEHVIDLAHRMGISSTIPEVPSIALGTADLSLFEMVRAYASFANLGQPVEPVVLLKIEDWQGNLLWESVLDESPDSVLTQETARAMVHLMSGVVERGTGKSLRWLFGLESDLAGKTGTTQDNADGWFIGYNPAIVAGAWVGADNPGIHFRTTALGQGAHTGLPIFARFMQRIERDPAYDSISMAQFPPLSDELLARLDCPDYSLEDPNMTLLEKLFDGFVKSDTAKAKRLSDPTVRKQEDEKKKKFFERLKSVFKKKR
ncbi:MAG: transglycosylase domain-containing protein [Bacteroidales bacterium]|nr:transglycosylase domain-containing protein [Bacteroidales bacterium]